MRLEWSVAAVSDLARLHAFLAPVAPGAADRAIESLVAAAGRLQTFPRMGRRLPRYEPDEVRRVVVGSYDMRYQLRDDTIMILRVWHTREHR